MRLCGRPASGLALFAALLLALGVAACGRKGGLDPPPAASAAGVQPAAQAESAQPRSISSGLAPTGARGSSKTLPPPPSPKRDIPIDFLLN